MFIEIETTPNPATLKFLPGRNLLEAGQTLELKSPEQAEELSPLAASLFKIAPVESVFIGYDFISVSKNDSADWEVLKPQILGIILERLVDGTPIMIAEQDIEAEEMEASEEDREVISQIRELLDTRVRPAVASDGGDIVFHGYREGVVFLSMRGACAGCPSSTATLKMGIENMLRHYIPDVIEVRPVA